ncbi:MAG: hypothetical protein SNH88_02855 [Rikenellaceae bacterium]
MQQFNLKRYYPLLLAIAVYTTISMLYFAPQLSGRVLLQSDVRQYEGMSKETTDFRAASGEDPQWTGRMFGGMPTYLINIAYPTQLIKRATTLIQSIAGEPAVFIIFAMLAMWLMLVMMGINSYVAIVGGAMYGLSTYFFIIIGVGHITKMWALAYAPLMFGGAYLTLRGRMWLGASLTALFTAIEVGANHPQITYYFLMAMGAFWISEAIYNYRAGLRKEFARRTALLVAAGLLGVLANFSQLWYIAEHTPETVRGGSALSSSPSESGGLDLGYATAWSYGKTESLNMLVPDLMGRESSHTFSPDGAVAEVLAPYNLSHIASQIPTYWGDQPFTAGPTYIGAVVLLLAALGFALSSARERWWIFAISLLMLALGWGSNFMPLTELMFNILPGYDKFRTVSMTLVILEWSAPLVATYALSKLWTMEKNSAALKPLAYSAGAVGGIALLLALFGGAMFDFKASESLQMLIGAGFPEDLATKVASAMSLERAEMLRADSLRSLLLILATAATVALLLLGRIRREVMLGVVMILLLIDLVPVNMRFLSHDDFQTPSMTKITASAIDKQIMQDRDPAYRVLNLSVSPFNDATTSYFHRSVGGYHGAKLSRYQDLIDNYLAKNDAGVLDMLNTKYIIIPSKEGSTELIKRSSANGAAWFVESLTPAASAREEMALLGKIDLKRMASVETSQNISTTRALSAGEIALEEYRPNYLRYRYNAEGEAVAIFSEIYYSRGWKAYIDGVEHRYFRANYLLRAMELPGGEHTVEWRFKAPKWGLIEAVSLIASLIIILSLIAVFIYERGQKIKA